MKLFYTSSTEHLQEYIDLPIGMMTIKTFSDGELFIAIDEDVSNKEVWVIASTNPPAKNMLETILILNALQRAGASINLLLTYFGYARQDKPESGEAASGQYFAQLFQHFNLQSVSIIHMHSTLLQTYLTYTNEIPYAIFEAQAIDYDVVAIPDKGAYAFGQKVADQCKKELILLEKFRPAKEQVKTVKLIGNVANKSVLIVDDMISTGNTVMHAAVNLKEHGATKIGVMATHNLINQDAMEQLELSPIEKIIVTNTIEPWIISSKLMVIDIGPFIEKIIQKGNLN
jgi:ribose-phosphate pyrophosphokinase